MCLLKRVILVRHGKAEHQLFDKFGGWSDAKLTELGIKQAQAVADSLKMELKEKYALYSSDLNWAKQTSEIIYNQLETPITYSKELREHNPGIASGMTRKEADQHLHEMTKPYIDSLTYPEAETFREFFNRVSGIMDKLDETEKQIIIVSHGGTIHNTNIGLSNPIEWWETGIILRLAENRFRDGLQKIKWSVTPLRGLWKHKNKHDWSWTGETVFGSLRGERFASGRLPRRTILFTIRIWRSDRGCSVISALGTYPRLITDRTLHDAPCEHEKNKKTSLPCQTGRTRSHWSTTPSWVR